MSSSAGSGHEAGLRVPAIWGARCHQREESYISPNRTSAEALMATLVRKNVFLDPTTLKRAQAILGRRSASAAIRDALALVAFRTKVMQGYDRAAEKGRGFRDACARR